MESINATRKATMLDASKPNETSATLWPRLKQQAQRLQASSPVLATDLEELVLHRASFSDALATVLLHALETVLPRHVDLAEVFSGLLAAHPEITESAAMDLEKLDAVNPACPDLLCGFLSFRGFQALQLYRLYHVLWIDGQQQLAVLLQNWGAIKYGIDIHPAANIGKAVFIDHGIGVVIGSTAVIEDNVNLWHGVTLGSTLTQAGDRHPKIRSGATVCAGATILGNIEIGAGAIVAAASVVLKNVPPGSVVAGVPAQVIGVAPERLNAIDADFKASSTQVQKG